MYSFDDIIDRKNTYSTQWDFIGERFEVDGLLPFTIADMDFKSPKAVLDAFQKALSHGIFGSSRWNNDTYLDAIKTWYNKRLDYKIDDQWILYAPSVVYSVSKLLQILNPNKESVFIFTPTYEGFPTMLSANGCHHLSTSLEYPICSTTFEAKVASSKVLLMCNPNNPDGKLWTKEELEYIIKICKKYGVYIISDDMYMDFVYKPNKLIPILKIAEELDYTDRTIILTSSSKTFNVIGCGGGYCLIPNKNTYDSLSHVFKKQDCTSAAMLFSVISTVSGYNSADKWLDDLLEYCHNNLKEVDGFLKTYVPQLNMSMPKSTFLAWINCSHLGLNSNEIQKRLMYKGKVGLIDGRYYGEEKPYVRMNIGCPRSKVKNGLEKIKLSLT